MPTVAELEAEVDRFRRAAKRTRTAPPPGAFTRPYGAKVEARVPAKPRTVPPIRPSHPLEVAYRRRLDRLIEAMNRSIRYYLAAAYRANPPRVAALSEAIDGLAQDEAPNRAIRAVFARLAARWRRRFDRAAKDLARYFATAAAERVETTLSSALRRGGWTVRLRTTPAVRDALAATIGENVALIRSIPARYLDGVERAVMASVAAGRDLAPLVREIDKLAMVSRKRARLIARDQNNRATATIHRVRLMELGITEAIWVHSGGGKEPRPSHLKAGRDKVIFDVKTGWFDPDEKRYIFPGEMINCRCVARPVISGFS